MKNGVVVKKSDEIQSKSSRRVSEVWKATKENNNRSFGCILLNDRLWKSQGSSPSNVQLVQFKVKKL